MKKKKLGMVSICLAMMLLTACASETENTASADGTITTEGSETGAGVSDETEESSVSGMDAVESGTENEIGSEMMSATESESETETESETEEPEVLTLTITATGDCTLGPTQSQSYSGSFTEYYDNYGETYFFDDVRDIFEADDFTLINLECVLTNSTDRVEKTFNLKGKPEYVGIMTCSSIEGCSLGNNHSSDYGAVSLTDTEAVLDEAGIIYGYNDHVAIFTAENGLTIGIVSANLLSQSQEQEDYIEDGIAALRDQGADIVIASCHWGIEKDYYPSDYQTTLARKIVDWGADLVIGNHPHVLQGIEYYNGKVICYSLGNFCFGGNKNPSDKNTAIYQQTFTFIDGELQADVDAKIIPCTVSSASSYNDFQPTVVSGDRKAAIISNMNDYSSPYSDIYFDEEGILQIQTSD